MPLSFDFSITTRIIFGPGKIDDVGEIILPHGKKVYILSGLPEGEILQRLIQALRKHGLEWELDYVNGEPTVESISGYLSRLKIFKSEAVIGIGGGSAMDTAKAVAVLYTNQGEIYDYLEVIGRGKQFVKPSLPVIAIPTTSGTGSEVTRNAVINETSKKVKVSLRSPWMLPKVALVDPELAISMPSDITASTGMDAITQLIEPFTSSKANPLTDAVCREGLRRAANSLREAYLNGGNLMARQDMALASMMSGIALSNSKLGVVHGFASVLGGLTNAPHGAICARLLPFTVAVNIQAMKERNKGNEALNKYNEIAKTLTGHENATLEDGVTWLQQLAQDLKINPLRHYGLVPGQFDEVIQQTKNASSTQGNPILLTDKELADILDRAF